MFLNLITCMKNKKLHYIGYISTLKPCLHKQHKSQTLFHYFYPDSKISQPLSYQWNSNLFWTSRSKTVSKPYQSCIRKYILISLIFIDVRILISSRHKLTHLKQLPTKHVYSWSELRRLSFLICYLIKLKGLIFLNKKCMNVKSSSPKMNI